MMVDSKNKVHVVIHWDYLTVLSLKRRKQLSHRTACDLIYIPCIQNKFCQILSIDPHSDLTTVIMTVENTKQDPLYTQPIVVHCHESLESRQLTKH